MSTTERVVGRYVVRIEQDGRGFVFDVLSAGGLLVASGIDLLSYTADAVFEKVAAKYGTGA